MSDLQETKLCKHCQTEIPKKAKVCPNCRKKQGGAAKWIIIAIIVLFIIGAATGGTNDNTPQKVGDVAKDTAPQTTNTNDDTVEPVQEPEEKETIFGIGEIAELNGVRVTMTDYSENSGSEFNKPSEGNVFVLVEFEIENNTDKELAISSMLSFEAYADDYALNYSLGALIENKDANQLDGSIAAGKKMKGVVGYELPEDWKELEVHFTDDVWSNNKFKFMVTK